MTPSGPGAEAFRAARERDPMGHRVHACLAFAHLACLPLTTAGSSITFAILLVYAILRLPRTWRCYTGLGRSPLGWAIAAWVAWTALSLLWSVDPAQGWDELRAMRMALLPAALWPLLALAPWLVGAALVGVAGQQVAQLLEHLGWVVLRPHDLAAGRLGGWIHPTQTGMWCTAAIVWHLVAALRHGGRLRVVSIAGLAAAAAGLLATGSRGPWIAAALTVPLTLIVTAWRLPRTRRPALVAAILLVAGLGAAWPVAGSFVTSRVEQAAREVREARTDGVYWTSAGLRVGLWRWAWTMYRDAPVAGVGAGGFRRALDDDPSYRAALDPWPPTAREAKYIARDHCHNTSLQVLATTGTIGGAIIVAVVLLALRAAWRDRIDHPYAAGSLFVLVAWVIGAQFDCYALNGHLLGLFMLVVAVTGAGRPPVTAA